MHNEKHDLFFKFLKTEEKSENKNLIAIKYANIMQFLID